jgi:thiamine pyrophosphokinase
MEHQITFPSGVTLVGAGEVTSEALERALQHAPTLVAADGGADRALHLGYRPEWVIGDMDSLGPARKLLPAERLIAAKGQDDTDFDKAIARIGAPFILAVGFTGARLDHTLAAMSTLARAPHRRVIVDAGVDLCFHAPPALALALAPGTRFSLFPLRPLQCRSTGLQWATDGLTLDPMQRIGTSNAVCGGRVTLAPDAPGLLVLAPISALATVLRGLGDAPLWPGPAPAQ